MPRDVTAQLDAILTKLGAILAAAGLTPEAVVEMTSYHTDVADSFDEIDAKLRAALGLPLPAWTAVEVAGLRRPCATLEIRFVLHAPTAAT